MLEMLVLLLAPERFSSYQKKMDVILNTFVVRDVSQKLILCDDSAKRMEHGLKLGKCRLLPAICVRLSDAHQGIIFYLTDSFAGYSVLLADSLQSHLLRDFAESVAI